MARTRDVYSEVTDDRAAVVWTRTQAKFDKYEYWGLCYIEYTYHIGTHVGLPYLLLLCQ